MLGGQIHKYLAYYYAADIFIAFLIVSSLIYTDFVHKCTEGGCFLCWYRDSSTLITTHNITVQELVTTIAILLKFEQGSEGGILIRKIINLKCTSQWGK